jgi:hypothetical protein
LRACVHAWLGWRAGWQTNFAYHSDDKTLRSGTGDCLDTNSDTKGTIEFKARVRSAPSFGAVVAGWR